MSPQPDDDVKYFYLLDNNVFRLLCETPGGHAIKTFNACLDTLPQPPSDGDSAALMLTPATLLEAIGVVPPTPNLRLPANLLRSEQSQEIMEFLLDGALRFYEGHPAMSKDVLVSRAEKQRSFVAPEAEPLFDICVARIVSSADFEKHVHTMLSFDYLYKYDYPSVVRADMHKLFVPHFFMKNEMISGLAKFRLGKQLWDVALREMERSFSGQPDFEEARKAMQIKTRRDLLDCDLVHLLCLGVTHDGASYPVAAFTTDDAKSILPRIAVYKGILEVVFDMCPASLRSQCLPGMSLRTDSVLAICRKDCSFESVVPLSRIKTVR
jgi:hypothetical protein